MYRIFGKEDIRNKLNLAKNGVQKWGFPPEQGFKNSKFLTF